MAFLHPKSCAFLLRDYEHARTFKAPPNLKVLHYVNVCKAKEVIGHCVRNAGFLCAFSTSRLVEPRDDADTSQFGLLPTYQKISRRGAPVAILKHDDDGLNNRIVLRDRNTFAERYL